MDEYTYLWDGSDPAWALVPLDRARGTPQRYVIVHLTSKQALLIDDDEQHKRVVQRMLAENVTVLSGVDAWMQQH